MTQDTKHAPIADSSDEALPDAAEKFGGKEADHADSPDQRDGDVPTGHDAEDRPPTNNARGPFAQETPKH